MSDDFELPSEPASQSLGSASADSSTPQGRVDRAYTVDELIDWLRWRADYAASKDNDDARRSFSQSADFLDDYKRLLASDEEFRNQVNAHAREAQDEIRRLTRENEELRAADRDHLAATRGMERRLSKELDDARQYIELLHSNSAAYGDALQEAIDAADAAEDRIKELENALGRRANLLAIAGKLSAQMVVEKRAFQSRTMELEGALAGVIGEIAAERRRQQDVEGWTPQHDDEHVNGEMAQAAISYAMHAVRSDKERKYLGPQFWPWDWSWWKPKDRRRDLIRAGALIVAEIERLDRTSLSTPPCGQPQKSGEPMSEAEGN